jgi:hypothetical protein
VKEYPDAGHSFLDDHKGLIGVLGVVIGASYKDIGYADRRNSVPRAELASRDPWLLKFATGASIRKGPAEPLFVRGHGGEPASGAG